MVQPRLFKDDEPPGPEALCPVCRGDFVVITEDEGYCFMCDKEWWGDGDYSKEEK